MKKLLVSLVLLALVGCGSNDSSTPPASSSSLVGTWLDIIDSNTAAVIAFTSTTWKAEIVVLLADGTYGVQMDSGTYSVSGSTVTLTKTASSCEGVATATVTKANADTFSRVGDHLTLTTSTTILAFQLDTTPPTGMGAAAIGCIDNNNKFITHAVTTVP